MHHKDERGSETVPLISGGLFIVVPLKPVHNIPLKPVHTIESIFISHLSKY